MADGKRRYKSDRKDYKVSVKLSEKDMDILKAALKRTGMTASAYIRELIRTGGNIDTSYPEDRARAIRIIAGIANNINQAVKLGNSQGRFITAISFLRSFREFMMRVLAEMLVKIRRKIRCGIGAEGDDSSADLFYNLKKVFEKSNKMFYNEIEIIYNKIVKLYS